ncbi:hypothetical protein HMPREF3214_00147 [Alloscardovia omnicolens]|nr:hypothetical protein HMPREF3214_00147 [Alloscardovia omnicolens]
MLVVCEVFWLCACTWVRNSVCVRAWRYFSAYFFVRDKNLRACRSQ